MCGDSKKILNSSPLFDHEINTNTTITIKTVGHRFAEEWQKLLNTTDKTQCQFNIKVSHIKH